MVTTAGATTERSSPKPLDSSAGRVISADSHIQEPDELYTERVPAQFRERAPRLVVNDDGSTYRVMDGKRPRRMDIAAARETDDDQNREFRNDDDGGRNLERRLADQQRDGVCGEVLYPNHSLALYNSPHSGYQLAVARAYNDWLMELVGGNLMRFRPVAIVPVADLDGAVSEAERVAKLGYGAIKIPITAIERPYNEPAYDRLWAVCEEAGLVLSFHAFTNSDDRYPEDWGEEEGKGGGLNLMTMSMVDGMNPVSLLISGGALMRFPALRFVVVECGAGWLAWLLYVMDEQYEKKHMWVRPVLDLKPSEYFERQGHVTFSDDPIALKHLDMPGGGKLMWGSDYPHDEGTFPHSQAVIARTFAGVADADRQRIVYDNAAALYGFSAS